MTYCEECGDPIREKGQICWETGGLCYSDRESSSHSRRADSAEYKGRRYKLLFIGATKYGERAHLGFWDGTKDFWVDAARVTR